MKHRFLLSLLVGLMIVMSCTMASADVIWEPNDKFYRTKYEDCEYLGRSFLANGEKGSVTIWKEPGSKSEVATAKNGSPLYVSFTYTDRSNKSWGVVQFEYDANGAIVKEYSSGENTGWIPMADLALVYDYISFNEEHEKEFLPYKGDYKEFMTSDEIVFWSYPGSGVINQTWANIDENFNITNTYTDSESRQWGFVGYYYATKNCWVCISDPTNTAIPAIAVETVPLITPSQTTAKPVIAETSDPKEMPVLLLLGGLVVLLVVGTAILIRVFWKKKTNS